MRLRVAIGGLVIELQSDAAVRAALERKFGAFLATDSSVQPDLELVLEAPRTDFSPEFHLEEGEPLTLAPRVDGSRVDIGGPVTGGLDLGRSGDRPCRGILVGAEHLGHVDALMRLGLSLLLPARDALLLHASAVEVGAGDEAAVFCGYSGRGKSTAARALGRALCDELVVLHVGADGIEVSGTPYWNGANRRMRLRRLVCLERDEEGEGELNELVGARALAVVSPHVARYAAVPTVDRQVFELVGRLVESRPVAHLACPTGTSYVPFLRSMLETRLGGA